MQYRTFKKINEKTSLLGMGCMRLPVDSNDTVKEEETIRIIRDAIDGGVNYVDTAFMYHNGQSEKILGKALKDGYREKILLADKMPIWFAKDEDGMRTIFEKQMTRLDTDCIDMYLIHNVDRGVWKRVQKLNLIPYLEELKAAGRIRHIGFSFHDSYDFFLEVLDAYDWDFCQIQYNYIDRDIQAGDKGYALAEKLGVPLVIMEPVKGGSLAALPEEVEAPFKEARPEASTSSWALRWVASHPDVHVVLSGMSTMEQVEDNLKTFGNFEPLTEKEEKIVEGVAAAIKARTKNGCTGCAYCMPCPHGVNIPKNFRIWNDLAMYGNEEITRQNYFKYLPEAERADKCKACGKCEKVCPQSLSIRENLKQVQKEMEALKNK